METKQLSFEFNYNTNRKMDVVEVFINYVKKRLLFDDSKIKMKNNKIYIDLYYQDKHTLSVALSHYNGKVKVTIL
ncbi:hypothetical protein [Paraliobacillus ryukyuensis]|uniref:hypothetical protein n=1 Tax=Paraliobacillus ryukyuensis TaxID=200904 RepID=UPI0009A69A6B|nr:hypothetical protein [Paraliobacillus ryukyuensis]